MSVSDVLDHPCVHHWMLMAPSGQVAAATCKNCGAEREFLDSDTRSTWNSGRARKRS